MRSSIATLLAVFCLTLVGCGGDDGDEPAANEGGTEAAPTLEPDPGAPEEGPGAPEEGSGASEGDRVTGAGAGDERGIRAAIEDAIASGDPQRACGAAVTEAYLRDTYGGAAGCRAAQSAGLAAETVDLGPISISGDQARTTVRAEGGPYAQEELRANLIRESDGWKLDGLGSTAPPGP